MLNKEVEKLLDCSNCELKECITCDITYTDRKKIREYIQKVEQLVDLIAEQLAGLTIWDIEKDEPLILGDKEEVINYFENKVNSKIQ